MSARTPVDPVGWVSRLSLLANTQSFWTRRNPPPAPRGATLGGLRAAPQSSLGYLPSHGVANPPYESARQRRSMSEQIPVGWVSRLSLLANPQSFWTRRNPPPTQRGATHGGLRAAPQSHPGYRPVFSVANPPYEFDCELSRMLP